ncbi:hypothetical protein VNO80_04313 [Phaseolus coccineus]|uniref:Uncharacterized protein n=1 Tax=Phaseolus coccineus TaxID=3886 RepID=A0AAN9NUN5_PHACN
MAKLTEHLSSSKFAVVSPVAPISILTSYSSNSKHSKVRRYHGLFTEDKSWRNRCHRVFTAVSDICMVVTSGLISLLRLRWKTNIRFTTEWFHLERFSTYQSSHSSPENVRRITRFLVVVAGSHLPACLRLSIISIFSPFPIIPSYATSVLATTQISALEENKPGPYPGTGSNQYLKLKYN